MAENLEQMVETLRAALSINPKDTWKRLRLGKLYLRLGRYPDAIEALERAIRDDPKMADAYVALGLVREQLGDITAFQTQLLQALSVVPDHVDARIELARLRTLQQRPAEALPLLIQANETKPDQPHILRALGQAQTANGDHLGALATLEQAYRIAPGNLEIMADLGASYVRGGHWKEARPVLEQHVEQSPGTAATRRALAQTYENLSLYTAALETHNLGLKQFPMDSEFRAGRARCLVALGRSAEVLADLELVAPTDAAACAELGRALLELKRPEEAQRVLMEGMRNHPGSAAVQEAWGHTLFALGKDQDSIGVFRQALRLDPRRVGAEMGLYEALVRVGRTSEALEALERAVIIAPGDPKLAVRLGRGRLAAGLAARAKEAFEKATQLDPKNPETWLGVADAAFALDDRAEASRALKRSVELDPNLGGAWLTLGRLELEGGQNEVACRNLEEAVRLLPGDVTALTLLGDALVVTRRFDRAILIYQSGANLSPKAPELWNKLGMAQLTARQLPDAIRSLEQVTILSPLQADGWVELGCAQAALERDGDAAKSLEEGVRLAPEDSRAKRELGLVLERLRQYPRAVEALRVARRGFPEDAAVIRALGHSCFELGLFDEARQCLEIGTRLDPRSAQMHLELGLALQSLKRVPEAELSLRQAVQLEPNSARARLALGQLLVAGGRPREALPELRQAAEARADWLEAWQAWAESALELQNSGEAERAYRHLTERRPQDATAWSGLAQAIELAGRVRDCIEPYQRSLRLAPDLTINRQRLGLALAKVEQFEEAAAALATALADDPADPAALEVLADCQLRLEKPKEAALTLERAAAQAPKLGRLQVKLGLTFDKLGREPPAIEALERALALGIRDPEVEQALGRLLRDSGERELQVDPEKGARLLERAMRWRVKDADLRWLLADAERRLGRFDVAQAIAREGVQLAPERVDFRILIGELALARNDVDRALTAFDEAASRQSSSFEALWGRARALVALGRTTAAIETLERASRLKPDSIDALALLGEQLRVDRRPKDAIPVLLKVTEARPLDPVPHRTLGLCLRDVGKHGDAVEHLRRALQRDANHLPTLRAYAESLVAIERYAEAIEPLEQLCEEQPDAEPLHALLGRSLAALNRDKAAVASLVIATRGQDDLDLVLLLSERLNRLGRYQESKASAERILVRSPRHLAALALTAEADFALGDEDAARRGFERVLGAAPERTDIRERLASLHQKRAESGLAQGDSGSAIRDLERAIELRPNDEMLHAALVRTLRSTKEPQRALEKARRGIQSCEKSATLKTAEGELLAEATLYREAVDAFASAVTWDPQSFAALTGQARALLALGEREKAVPLYCDALKVEPLAVNAWTELANLQCELDNKIAIIEAYERLSELRPLDSQELARWGMSANAIGRHQEAAELLPKALALAPENAALQFALGQSEFANSHWDAARLSLLAFLEAKPDSADALSLLAKSQAELGRFSEAVASYSRVACMAPEDVVLARAWVAAAAQEGSPELRAQALRHLTRLTPDEQEGDIALAKALRELGQLKAAIQALEHALVLQPRSPGVLRSLAELNLAWSRQEADAEAQGQAVTLLQRAVELGQDEPELLLEAATELKKRGEWALARDAAQAALDGDSELIEAALLLGEAQAILNAPERAVAAFEHAVRRRLHLLPALLGLAEAHLVLNHTGEAAQVATRACEVAPKDLRALELAVRALEADKRIEGTFEYFRRIVALAPERSDVRRHFATLLGELGEHEERVELLESHPQEGEDLAQLASAYYDLGAFSKALANAEAALKVAPSNGSVRAILGRALLELGEESRGLDELESALDASPPAEGVRELFVSRLTAQANAAPGTRQAVLALKRALVRAPHDGSLWLLLAQNARSEGDVQTALDASRRCVDEGGIEGAWLIQGAIYTEKGDLAAAEKAYEGALKRTPRARQPLVQLARTRQALGRHQDALAPLLVCLADAPEDQEVLTLVGGLFDHLGQPSDAVRAWIKLRQVAGLNCDQSVLLGRRLEELGRLEEAGDAFEEALELDPQKPDALSALGRVRLHGNRLQDALAPLEKARRLTPDDPDNLRLLGETLAALGRGEEAVVAYGQSVELSPTPAGLRQLADAAEQVGNSKVQIDALERLAKLRPAETVHGRLAELQMAGGSRRAALGSLREAVKQTPERALQTRLGKLLVEEAVEAIDLGEPERAQELLRESIEYTRELPDLAYIVAKSLWRAGARNLAFEVAEATKVTLTSATGTGEAPQLTHDVELLLAQIEVERGQKEAGLQHYEWALVACLDSLPALLGAAQLELSIGARDAALIRLGRALRLAPNNEPCLALLLQEAPLAQDQGKAIGVLEEAARLRPEDARIRQLLADSFAKQGRRAECATWLEQATALEATLDRWLTLAELYDHLGRTSESLHAADQALSLEPKSALGRLWAGFALAALGKYAQAIEHLQALEPNGISETARKRLAEIFGAYATSLAATNPQKTVDWCTKALRLCEDPELALLGARCALGLGRLQEATGFAKQLVAARPEQLDGHLILGEAYTRAGSDHDAMAAFGAALSLDRSSLQAQRGHGLSAERLRRHDLAFPNLLAAANQTREEPVLTALARAAHATGASGEEQSALVQLQALRSLDAQESLWLGELLLNSGDFLGAAPHLTQAADQATPSADQLWTLASVLEKAGDIAAALRRLEQLAVLEPSHRKVHGKIAALRAGTGQNEEAIRAYERALALDGPQVGTLQALADCYEALGRTPEMVKALTQLAQLEPSAKIHERLGLALLRTGHADEGAAFLDRALVADRNLPAARASLLPLLTARAQELSRTKRHSEALGVLERATELDPQRGPLWVMLGSGRIEANDPKGARKALERALQLDPNQPEAQYLLFTACERIDDVDAALVAGELARQAQSDPRLDRRLARLYETAGRISDAESAYARAAATDPSDIVSALGWARSAEKLGHDEPCLEALAQALRTEPANRLANRLKAVVLLRNERYEEAIPVLQWFIGQEPSIDLYQSLDLCYQKLGRSSERIPLLEAASQLAPEDAALWGEIGKLRLAANEPELALDALERAVVLAPSPEIRELIGEACARLGVAAWQLAQLEEAKRWLSRSAELLPKRADVLSILARVQERLGRNDIAYALASRAIELDPGRQEAVAIVATRLCDQGKHAEAQRLCMPATVRAPQDVTLAFVAARCEVELRQFEAALPRLQLILAREPNHAGALVLLGRAQTASGNPDAARATFERALPLAPRNPELLQRLGTLYCAQGQYPAAVEVLGRCLSIDPARPAAAFSLANALLELRRPADASEMLAMVLSRCPNESLLHLALGSSLSAERKYAAALGALQRAAELGEASAELHRRIGECAYATGDFRRASLALRKSLEVEPNQLESLRRLANAELMLGNGDEATRVLSRAVALSPRDPRVHFELASVHIRTHRFDLARAEHDLLIQLDPRLAAQLRSLFPGQ